jgi:hypothetical protein
LDYRRSLDDSGVERIYLEQDVRIQADSPGAP